MPGELHLGVGSDRWRNRYADRGQRCCGSFSRGFAGCVAGRLGAGVVGGNNRRRASVARGSRGRGGIVGGHSSRGRGGGRAIIAGRAWDDGWRALLGLHRLAAGRKSQTQDGDQCQHGETSRTKYR